MLARLLACLALLLAVAPPASGDVRIIAFGDSITLGYGDDPGGRGYPGRLQSWLRGAGLPVTVANRGIGGETTAQGLARIGSVLDEGGELFLLMEGTNDVYRNLSTETIQFNLNALATHAEARGLRVVQATIVPHRPDGIGDNDNEQTIALRGAVLGLAGREGRPVVDAFSWFWDLPSYWLTHYLDDPEDPVGHPNGVGYDLLTDAFYRVVAPLVSREPSGRIVQLTSPVRAGELARFGIDLDGLQESVRWRFGDGGRASGLAENRYGAAHLFTAPGSYEVSVEVTTMEGAVLTDRIQVAVTGEPAAVVTSSSLLPLARRERRGAGASTRSALWLTNTGPGPARVELEPLLAGPVRRSAAAKQAASWATLALGPGESVEVADVLLALGVAEGSAAIRLRASGPAARGVPRVRGEIRIEDREPGLPLATTVVPSVPESDWNASPRGLPLRALGVDAPAALAIANPEAGPRNLVLRLRTAAGGDLGTAALTLPGRSFALRSLLRLFPEADGETGPLGLELDTDGALVAAVEHGMEGGRDRLFALVRPRPATAPVFLGIAGDHAPGRSRRLFLFNPDPGPVTVTLALLEDGAGSQPQTVALALGGGESREIAEPRLTLFGAGEGAGLLRIAWSGGLSGPYLAAAIDRHPLSPIGSGTAATPEGSPAIASEGFVPLPAPGAAWTSTLRLLEAGARSTSVRVELLDALGEPLGVRYVSLDARGLSERALTSLFPGPVDGLGRQLRVEIESGGPVIVWLVAEHAEGDFALAQGKPATAP